MKKIILCCLTVFVMALSLSSCQDKEFTDTRVTNYATVELSGDDYMIVDKGSKFTDPGYYAEMAGEDVTSQVKVNSNVNTAKSGVYSIEYTMTNSDGFSSSASRTVVVLDPNDPIEGFYYTDPTSYRDRSGALTQYGRSFEILVIGKGDGYYEIDDILGGYYCQRAGYGVNYACDAIVKVADNGQLELISNGVPGWGDSADALTGTYDAATSTFSFDTKYAGMDFYVTMSK